MVSKEGHESTEVVDNRARSDALVGRRKTLIVVMLAVLISAWAIVNFTAQGIGFAVLVSGKLQGGEEAASALARLFAALVLILFLVENEGWRLRWVAAGLVFLGLGHLIFGYLEPLIQNDPPELRESLYESLVTQVAACALFATGLLPRTPPRLSVRVAAIFLATAPVIGYFFVFEILEGEDWMPRLSLVDSPEEAVELGNSLIWLTPWHWVLSALPLGLAGLAVVGAFRQYRRGLLRYWLLFAMVLLAGSILHEYLWPSAYGGAVLTSADLLSLAFALVVAIGGILELRRIATERQALLAAERERVRRLDELTALRADFSAMVAHELGNPISALGTLTAMLGTEDLEPQTRVSTLAAVRGEMDTLNALVADVRAAAAAEQDDFEVEPCPLPLAALLTDAEAYARTLPGDHPVKVTLNGDLGAHERVFADPKRVGQVLRNLLSNASKYSPEGSLIELRAARSDRRHVRIEVTDRGEGISPYDMVRIFEKFGRGSDVKGKRKVAGAGLGLYLSRRIVRTHGSELTVDTRPGEGSIFGFELEVIG
jgi:signal transduction histidine kinase